MSVCLVMIVKNEAHCISRCLESVKPYIDHWVICDTGSIDFTEQIVKDVMKDIPGEFHKHEWVDFATNRNRAIELAKDKADYTLMMDADDFLVVSNKSVFKNLTAPAYNIKLYLGNIVYSRPQLIHKSVDCKYVGVLHEYVELPPSIGPTPLNGCVIRCGSVGARSRNPEKYLKDAEILRTAIIKDPDNARNYFYCAQSYRDAGNPDAALIFYLKRGEMLNGYSEERYVSYLEAAKIIEVRQPDDVGTITVTYLKAHEVNPNRAEALTYLAIYYRRINLLPGAYAFAKMATTINKPADALFMEPGCYDWQAYDEVAVAGYYLGKYQEALETNQRLLGSGYLPPWEVDRVKTNLQFCKDKLGV